ncbi:MAG: dTDP-4-dehydrorhamnose reductase [Clostridiales bacterium]|nr:dTDP-4-dehydrorhamnose reductase [Clostridiales bacterium]
MKKIWIVGVKGHVGSALMELLNLQSYELFPTDKDEVDVTDRDEVRMFMQRNRPDVVINCAGITDPQQCENDPDEAYRVNALGARNIAAEAEPVNCKVIQFSTDDVFDLNKSFPYTEFDVAMPNNVYGKSKYAGERMIVSLSTRYVIVRSSWVYGIGKDFVNTVLEAADSGAELRVPINQIACPTSAAELAKVIKQFIDQDIYGIYHAVCKGSCSRYEFAQEILRLTGKTANLVPVDSDHGMRPKYSVLDNMMLRLEGLEEPKDWKTALADYIKATGGKG